MSTQREDEIARIVREHIRVGPIGSNSREIIERGGHVWLTPSEAREVAVAVLAFMAPELDALEAENAKLRQQLAATTYGRVTPSPTSNALMKRR